MKNIHDLEVNNECYTYDYAVFPLLKYMEKFRDKIIWCPCDTADSEFVKIFKTEGFNVIHSHIWDGKDFFLWEPEHFDVIITNPPFQGKADIFKRLLSFNKPFAVLMTLSWLNDSAPKKLFREKDLQLLMFEERMHFRNTPKEKINFSTAYYCYDFLPKQILNESLKVNKDQQKLF